MVDSAVVDESLEGRRVIANDGTELGVVSGVRSGTVYVDLAPGLGERHLAKLGLDGVDQADYPLGADAIEAVTDDAVYLQEL